MLIKPINVHDAENAEYIAAGQLAQRGVKDEQLVTAVLGFLNNNMLKQEYLYNQRKFYDRAAMGAMCKLIHDGAASIYALKHPAIEQTEDEQ